MQPQIDQNEKAYYITVHWPDICICLIKLYYLYSLYETPTVSNL